jgi:Zn-dependent peptidase ImmA (M78 family)/transcriptional regulator with XRE-family HTH domain
VTDHVFDSIDARLLGTRLAQFRKARGLSQKDAADVLGVARTTVVAMEKGERRPRPQELVELAQLYGRQVGDFLRPQARSTPEPFVVQFRAARQYQRVGADKAIDRDIQTFQELCENYLELERLTDSPMVRWYPDVYDTAEAAPERAAEEVAASERNRLGLGDGPISNIWSLLESDVGIRVFAIDFESSYTAGLFVFNEDLGACIAVNARHPEERRRWSAAHEYGHFLTNRYRPDVSVMRTYRRVPESERFADSFARHFLMPSSGLIRRFNAKKRANNGTVTPAQILELSHQYSVSFQAMVLWLEQLRLVQPETWDRLKERGFKPTEAKRKLGLPPEPRRLQALPMRYKTLAVQAYRSEQLSEGQLARFLHTDRVGARQIVEEIEGTSYFDDGEVRQLALDFETALTQA